MSQNLKNLPPTPDSPLMVPETKEALKAELLALRILVSTLVWKAGGAVDVSQADMELAMSICALHASPIQGGTRWWVKESTPLSMRRAKTN